MRKLTAKDKNLLNSENIINTEIVEDISTSDMESLCDITISTIAEQQNFLWRTPPTPEILERFWRGVLAVPERSLIITRIENTICGAIQLIQSSKQNELQSFSANLFGCFVAPWAKEYTVKEELIKTAENLAIEKGINVLNIDFQEKDLELKAILENKNYTCWGTHPKYVRINNEFIKGFFYTKLLIDDSNNISYRKNDENILSLVKI